MKAIENLMEKKGKFDYILLETTGLADPGKLANGWTDEEWELTRLKLYFELFYVWLEYHIGQDERRFCLIGYFAVIA